MKYRIISTIDGKDLTDDPLSYICTPNGEVAYWSDWAGWEVEDQQEDYRVELVEE